MTFIGLGIIIYLPLQAATIQTIILLSVLEPSLQSQQDAISIYDARFSHARDALSATENSIGYIGCPDLDSETRSYYYFLAQYALMPIVVDDRLNKTRILGNFPSELCDISSIDLEQNNLLIVQEYGDGIFLLESGE